MDKVIQYISSLTDNGAETLVKDYATLIDKSKIEPIVLVNYPRDDTANAKLIKDAGIRVVSVYPTYNFLTKVFDKLFRRWYIPHFINRLIQKEQPIAMHIHLANLRYVAPIKEKIKGVRLFYTCHSLPHRHFSGKNQIETSAAKELIASNGLQMIAINSDMVNELNMLFDIDNTVYIRNGIDFSRFESITESKEEIRQTLQIPNDAYVVGQVGNFNKNKNHSFTIRVFEKLVQKREDAFLFFVGAGPREAELREEIEKLHLTDRFLLLSHRSDIPRLLKAMDVFIFPSKFEGLGIALVEAQKMGLRCVSSDRVPSDAIVTANAISLSLDDSPETWANALLDCSLQSEVHGELHDYDMNQEIKKLESMYLGH